jgi:hypothetical protein
MKSFQVQFVPGLTLAGVAGDQAQAYQLTNFLTTVSAQGWNCDHLFEVSGGLLYVLSKPKA